MNQVPPTPITTTQTQTPSPQNTDKKSKLITIIFGIFLLIATNVVSYSLGSKNNSSENDNMGESIDLVANNLEQPTPPPQNEDPRETPTPTTAPRITTRIFTTESELEGFVTSNEEVDSTSPLQIGRNESHVVRSFVSFDISSLPGGINIQAAKLKMYQQKTTGTPYTTNGEIRIDHLTYGNTLDAEDYSLPALVVNFTTLSTSKRVGLKEIDVTSVVRDDIANARSRTQFRFHAAKELTGGDLAGDIAYFQASELGPSETSPQLVIDYY